MGDIVGFGGGGFGGLPPGMGGMGGSSGTGETGISGTQTQDGTTEQGMQQEGGPMTLLNTTIPGVLLFLGIALVGTGLFMFSMVKVWSPRIWLPMILGLGIAIGGQSFKLRSKKIMASFGAAQVCEVCGVELALRQCFGCARWFGPGCQGKSYDAHGELREDDTRCIECMTCAICGGVSKGYQCLQCGNRVCLQCLGEAQRYCLRCAGRLKIARGSEKIEEVEASEGKVVVMKSPFGLPSALVRRITQKVKSDIVGKELVLGKAYPSLGTMFRLVGSSPSNKVLVLDTTRVKIED